MRLGQHFLINDKVIEKFVSYVNFSIRPIIEIGGGKGSITKFLHPDLVIEIDKSLASFLPNVIIGDGRALPITRGQIVSSLPYYITFDFFEEVSKLNSVRYLTLILQLDFVKKIINEPTYISYLLNYYYRIDVKDIIPPWFFSPRPKVFSAIVSLTRTRNFDQRINNLLKCVSKYRNKNLSKALELCGLKAQQLDNKKVREFKPWEVRELLRSMGIEYV